MELNIEKKQQLERLLAKPNSATQEHIPFLQQLIKTFPYYQPLHLLLAKASSNSENQHSTFTKAALFTNGSILHRIIHEPQKLTTVEDINVITYQPWHNIHSVEIVDELLTAPAIETTPQAPSTTITEAPEIENLAPLANEIIAIEPTDENELLQEEKIEEALIAVQENKIDFVVPEIENIAPLQDEIIKVCEPQTIAPETENLAEALETDEQETFEEITEVVMPSDAIQEQEVAIAEEYIDEEEILIPEEINEVIKEPIPEIAEIKEEPAAQEKEELDIETFAGTDFFAFDRNFSSEKISEEEAETEPDEITEAPSFSLHTAQENVISKYDDDKLPFTFLWWLAKTRKDHEQIFRPFASPVNSNAQPLQQQYVEHIFHIQAPLEPGEESTEEQIALATQTTKESEIIDNFIKNDPQIKALKPDQINNENKAKKSAEDSNDLVSETLAQIYIEQMLYHKAIDTYQKLSLKFPEKSGYFADLIQSLEKKI